MTGKAARAEMSGPFFGALARRRMIDARNLTAGGRHNYPVSERTQ
ncbi:hypothetical protein SPHINGOR109_50405 [Sphingorhabdus sp. 109]|nr:hypothetical protein SPHINGOR109_50405 [Sphingorhabdus sp. 109]